VTGSPAPAGEGRLLSLDLWHTLLYLDPEAEERYMRAQIDLAVEVLSQAPLAAGPAPPEPDGFRGTFETVYADAVAASQEGRSVPPGAQIVQAGARTGRTPDPRRYLDGLRDLVAGTPFRRAPGAVDVISQLRDEGWATAVVSNTVGEPGEALRPVLTRMGYDPLIDAFVFSDEGPWTKPAPEIFQAALHRMGIGASRTVHVGDGWVDIEGARRARLRAGVLYTGLQHYGHRYRQLFLPPGWSSPETRYRVDRWAELPGVLRTIL